MKIRPGDDLSYYLGPNAVCATPEQCEEVKRAFAEAERAVRNMTTLALDIATKTGWACSDGTSGVMDFGPFKEDFGRLGWAFEEWLRAHLVRVGPIDRLVVERPFYRGASSTVYMLNGLAFLAQKVAFATRLERAEHTVFDVRKFICGNRLAKKKAVMDWACAQGFDPEDDNEADALALLTYDLNREQARAA